MITGALRPSPSNWLICASAIASVFIVGAASAQSPPPLSSAAVDLTIYRDGEVKRFSSVHGKWIVVCDEVMRLKQRFCSLRTTILDHEGKRVAAMTVSTGQDGRPAALVEMVAQHVRGGTLEIAIPAAIQAVPSATQGANSATQPKQKIAPPVAASTMRLRPIGCDADRCSLIWTLQPEQIRALNDSGIKLTVTAGADLSSLSSLKPNKRISISLGLSADGFRDAVATSLKPFE
jgi:invasion protein IalB